MCSKRDSDIDQPIFKTPHLPISRTASQYNFQKSMPLADISQTLSNEKVVENFWSNFNDKIGVSPTESRISVSVFILLL